MKYKLIYYIPVIMLLLITASAFSQTARLQVIHNAADPAADSVDIYLNGTLLLDNFKFRTATPFIDAPAGTMINVGVAGPNSTSASDTLVNFELTLTPDETYVAIANGVLNPGSFAPNPDGVGTGFTLFIKTMARESGSGSNVDFAILHGSTDAPSVDIYARNVAQLVDNAGYSAITDYLSVPADNYLIDIKDSTSSVLVGTFEADLSGLSGGAAIVFASGFLTPSANQNGAGFGVYAALANGVVVEFEPVTTARLQVIHNAADPAADSVDIYLNGTLLLDNFKFRTATPFIDAPAGTMINVGVAGPNSTSASDTLVNFELTLTPDETYVAIANGVLNPGSFAPNPDGVGTGFTLFIKSSAREIALDTSNVEFIGLHGVTDAPIVDIIARGVATLIDDVKYSEISDYVGVPPLMYTIDITPGNDNSTIVGSYQVDLSGLQGGTAVVFASGFLLPDSNQGGKPFGLFAALANGTVIEFSPVTGVNDQKNEVPSGYQLSQNYPNPFNPVTKISFVIPIAQQVTIKIYNVLGNEVETLFEGFKNAGQHDFYFSAENLASGVYYYTMKAGNFSSTKKMMLIR